MAAPARVESRLRTRPVARRTAGAARRAQHAGSAVVVRRERAPRGVERSAPERRRDEGDDGDAVERERDDAERDDVASGVEPVAERPDEGDSSDAEAAATQGDEHREGDSSEAEAAASMGEGDGGEDRRPAGRSRRPGRRPEPASPASSCPLDATSDIRM